MPEKNAFESMCQVSNLGGDEKINIDQQIYFLTSLGLYEKYKINNELIQQKVGCFLDGIYIPDESIEQNFLKRRQNFHGTQLIALAGEYRNYIQVENLKNTPYFPSNGTYDVTNFVHGSMFDIWMILQKNLNFTTKIYTRKDDKWGVPIQHPNGSISVPDGIIKDAMEGSADVLLAYLVIMYDRYLAIDYLIPLESSANGIYVKKDSIHESLDFQVFQMPFNKWTWTILIISSSIVSISIFLTYTVLNQGNFNCLNFMEIFVKSLKANLGNASFTNTTIEFNSLQMVIFVALITGNIIWITYNGALLSKLVKPKFDKPFHDLKSLSKSNYR